MAEALRRLTLTERLQRMERRLRAAEVKASQVGQAPFTQTGTTVTGTGARPNYSGSGSGYPLSVDSTQTFDGIEVTKPGLYLVGYNATFVVGSQDPSGPPYDTFPTDGLETKLYADTPWAGDAGSGQFILEAVTPFDGSLDLDTGEEVVLPATDPSPESQLLRLAAPGPGTLKLAGRQINGHAYNDIRAVASIFANYVHD